MNRNRGFTLVELLVVMAIIAILAAIAVPNVVKHLRRAKMTAAVTEIGNIELSLTKMLGDAQLNSMHQLFNSEGVRTVIVQRMADEGVNAFVAAQWLYTNTMYALLRSGRLALTESFDGLDFSYVLNGSVVQKLGTGYFSELEFDPWGLKYQIFPGPWPKRDFGPCVFRSYMKAKNDLDRLPGGSRDLTDNFTISDWVNPDTGETIDYVNLVAPTDKEVYIYSPGDDTISSQMDWYGATVGDYPTPSVLDEPYEWFANAQDPDDFFGGDDINNWDQNESWSRFY